MVLTSNQRNALNGAILDYLKENNFLNAHEALSQECSNITPPKSSKLLEKKWTTVVKLEKKIQDLEATVKRLEVELKNTNPMSSVFTSKNRNKDTVPQSVKCTLTGHRSSITHIQFHPSYSVICSSSEDTTLRVWDAESGQLERQLRGHTDSVNHFDFHPEGIQLASCSSDLSIKIWDFQKTFNCVRTLTGHEHTVSRVVYVEGGAKLVSCSRDHSIRIWESDTGYCTRTLAGHTDWVKCLCSSLNSTYIASGALDKTVRVWDTSSGKCLTQIRDFEKHVEAVAFGSPKTDAILAPGTEEDIDNYIPSIVAVGDRDNKVRVYNIRTSMCLLQFSGHDNWVRALTFHPNGKFLISVSDDSSIRVWDVKTRRCYFTLDEAHESFIQCCAWNPQLGLFASGGVDKKVKIWICG